MIKFLLATIAVAQQEQLYVPVGMTRDELAQLKDQLGQSYYLLIG